jgi:hypothetical protein
MSKRGRRNGNRKVRVDQDEAAARNETIEIRWQRGNRLLEEGDGNLKDD